MAAITRHHHADNNTTSRRRRHQPAPDLPTPQFRYLMNGNYEAIIDGATHGFVVKAYTPGKCWRIFYIAPDGSRDELEQRFPFDMPAVAMWTLLAKTAYDLTLKDDREADEVTSPAPTSHCPSGAIPF